jgi:hypothetical protein
VRRLPERGRVGLATQMRVIATTVVREAIRGRQRSGYIYDVDWEPRRVRRRLPVPEPRFPESDDNPRGGVRGGRGVAVTKHGILVANYDTLLRYDDEWNLVGELSHPLFVGIHEIDWDGRHVWVASTGIDAVLRVSLDGDVEVAWDPHMDGIAPKLGLRVRRHPTDGSVDYRVREAPLLDQCHLNGVVRREGELIANLGLVRKSRPSAVRALNRIRARLGRALGRRDRWRPDRRNSGSAMVVRVTRAGAAEVLVELADHDFPTHNGQLIDDERLAVNDSTANMLRIFKIPDGSQIGHVDVPGTWLRGLEPLENSHALVGTAPAAIVQVDLEAAGIVARLQLSDDPNEAVHGLALCPPPARRI